jgi:hypothetical protein
MSGRAKFRSCGALVALLVLLCSACAGGFEPRRLGKTDIDMMADASLRALDGHLRELTVKLYRRNPRELRKVTGQTIDTRVQMLFDKPGPLRFDELQGNAGIEAMLLGFDEQFEGDRVFAVMAGLTDMLRKSYGYKTEFFMLDELNAQKLHDSARNIEILVWRLSQKRDSAGQLFLLTNESQESSSNLSFERLFGKMIAIQDMMATIVADRSQRSINRMVHGVASMVFLPI